MINRFCEICNLENPPYTCPKCSVLYCSLKCYKSPPHKSCSEKFYKKKEKELAYDAPEPQHSLSESQDRSKLLQILNQFNESASQSSSNTTKWVYEIPKPKLAENLSKDSINSLLGRLERDDRDKVASSKCSLLSDLIDVDYVNEDEDSSRSLTKQEEEELADLIENSTPKRLLNSLSFEQQRRFEDLLKNSDCVD